MALVFGLLAKLEFLRGPGHAVLAGGGRKPLRAQGLAEQPSNPKATWV